MTGVARKRSRRDVMGGVTRVAVTAVYLDMLWLLACLPVVTAPAATVSLLSAVRGWTVDAETPTAGAFFRELRRNFVSGLALAGVQVGVVAFLLLDLYAIGLMGPQRRFWLIAWLTVTVVFALVQVFGLPASAARKMGAWDAVLAAARTAVRHPLSAALAVCLVAVAAIASAAMPALLVVTAVTVAGGLDLLWRRAAARDSETTAPPSGSDLVG